MVTLELLDAVKKSDAGRIGVVGQVSVQTDGFAGVGDVVRVSSHSDGPMCPERRGENHHMEAWLV